LSIYCANDHCTILIDDTNPQIQWSACVEESLVFSLEMYGSAAFAAKSLKNSPAYAAKELLTVSTSKVSLKPFSSKAPKESNHFSSAS